MKSAIILLILISFSTGCMPTEKSAQGFRLPDGDAAAGELVFKNGNCAECHVVHSELAAKQPALKYVVLGGSVTRIRTYGDLVTSIINPSHKISRAVPENQQLDDDRSLMEFAGINDQLTVTELIDLVAYLQDQYRVVPPDIRPYTYEYP